MEIKGTILAVWNDGRARKEEPGVLVACISLTWIRERGGAVPSLMDLVRGELSLALSSVSRLLGIPKGNLFIVQEFQEL